MTKSQTSIRLTGEAKRLLYLLALKQGVSQAAIIELAIRQWAKKEGVK